MTASEIAANSLRFAATLGEMAGRMCISMTSPRSRATRRSESIRVSSPMKAGAVVSQPSADVPNEWL